MNQQKLLSYSILSLDQSFAPGHERVSDQLDGLERPRRSDLHFIPQRNYGLGAQPRNHSDLEAKKENRRGTMLKDLSSILVYHFYSMHSIFALPG